VREQPRLFKDSDGHGTYISKGVVESVLVEPFTRCGPALLRTITQREKRFFATQRSTFTRYAKYFIGF
jgi:hypothetical protein